jgi:hypothetical protein
MHSLSVLLLSMIVNGTPAPATAARPATPLDKTGVQAMMTSDRRHLRAVDKRVSDAIADGLGRSATFVSLVEALDRSDVIVYIETSRSMPSSLAGRMLIAAGPANQRYLRIQLSAAPRGVELISLIGHELQHALEVAASPQVRDEQSLITLYRAIGHGPRGQHKYDTVAAQNAGRQVRTELIG